MSTEQKKKRIPWNKGLTKETDERVKRNAENTKLGCLRKYGVSNVFQSTEVLEKMSDDRHSGKLAQKAKQTKLERYGDPNYNNMTKSKQTKLERYADEYYNNMSKMYATKTKNKTYNTSKPEEEYYKKLCDKYGEEDVIRQYQDERYPFKCDFYIKSEDLFIELNYHQSHGEHPYNSENENDRKLVATWKSKQNKSERKNQYWIYEKVFTVQDPLKLEYAKKNKLNYLMIYRNNLEIKI